MFATSDLQRRHSQEFLAYFAEMLELPGVVPAASRTERDQTQIAANRELYGRMEMAVLQA